MSFLRKLTNLFRRQRLETEMAEEMRLHVEWQTERNLAAGMSADEARDAALREFGNVASLQERVREQRGWLWIENLWRDTSFALRTLGKCPGYTSVVVLTLALGLGVNTALFTWFNAAAFRPLPVMDPGQLFSLSRLDPNGKESSAMSYADYVAYRDHQTVFSGLTAVAGSSVDLLDTGEPNAAGESQPVGAFLESVSTNFFSVFGVPMALGRPLVPADETSTRASPVIVLSHRFWQSYFGGDPAVVGRTLRIRGLAEETLTVVGVAAAEFHGTRPGSPAGWVPLLMRSGEAWRADLKATNYKLIGRLRAGISREDAAAQLTVIANELLVRPHVGAAKPESVFLLNASAYLNLTPQQWLLLVPMFCLFGAVFLISCANASNLILARAVTRQFEFAVRSALGASRGRLFAQMMTENVVLGVVAGLVGWGVSAALLQFAWPWLLDMIPQARDGTAGLVLHADHRVFVFTLTVSVLAGIAGGFFPALQVTRRNVDSALKQDGSAFGRGMRVSRVRSMLAVGQLALSSALVFTAGLLAHRAVSSRTTEAGFDRSTVIAFETLAPRAFEPGQVDNARRQVLARLRALPEVAAVSEVPNRPFVPRPTQVLVGGENPGTAPRRVSAIYAAVPSDYFATLQQPVLRGRAFSPEELPDDQVALISESAARAFWPAGDALGQRFEVPSNILPGRESSAGAAAAPDANVPRSSLTVIGIVSDTRIYDPWSPENPVIHLPAAPRTEATPYLIVRLRQATTPLPAALRQVGLDVTGIAPRLMTVDDLLAGAEVQYRVLAWVAGILAFISLVVAVIGLYGVMSFTVGQRIKEIGVRIALGATPGRVVAGIVFDSLRLVGMGAALGYGLSLLIAHGARALLLGVSTFAPAVGIAVALLLGALGVFACWLPARRAARVDPMVALRAE